MMQPGLIQRESGRQIIDAAWRAMEAIQAVLSDPEIRFRGLVQAKVELLTEARNALRDALPLV